MLAIGNNHLRIKEDFKQVNSDDFSFCRNMVNISYTTNIIISNVNTIVEYINDPSGRFAKDKRKTTYEDLLKLCDNAKVSITVNEGSFDIFVGYDIKYIHDIICSKVESLDINDNVSVACKCKGGYEDSFKIPKSEVLKLEGEILSHLSNLLRNIWNEDNMLSLLDNTLGLLQCNNFGIFSIFKHPLMSIDITKLMDGSGPDIKDKYENICKFVKKNMKTPIKENTKKAEEKPPKKEEKSPKKTDDATMYKAQIQLLKEQNESLLQKTSELNGIITMLTRDNQELVSKVKTLEKYREDYKQQENRLNTMDEIIKNIKDLTMKTVQ